MQTIYIYLLNNEPQNLEVISEEGKRTNVSIDQEIKDAVKVLETKYLASIPEPEQEIFILNKQINEKIEVIEKIEEEKLQISEKLNEAQTKIETVRMQLEDMLSSEELNEMVNIYDQWEIGKNYIEGQKVAYNNNLYFVRIGHLSQADWTPDIAKALFGKIVPPSVIPTFTPPTGAHDSYSAGDLVSIDGRVYRVKPNLTGIVHSPLDQPQLWDDLGTLEEYHESVNPKPEVPEAPVDPKPTDPEEPTDPDPEPEVPSEPEPAAGSLENPFVYEVWNGIPYGQEGSKGIYKTGEYVQFPEGIYLSKIDNNTWTPQTNAAGWDKVE